MTTLQNVLLFAHLLGMAAIPGFPAPIFLVLLGRRTYRFGGES